MRSSRSCQTAIRGCVIGTHIIGESCGDLCLLQKTQSHELIMRHGVIQALYNKILQPSRLLPFTINKSGLLEWGLEL